MRNRLLAAFLFGAVLTLGLGLSPDEAHAQDETGASVVVLKFERFNASDDAMTAFYDALEEAIDAHPDMYVKEGGEVTINDLALTAGCAEPNAECLVKLRDMLDSDRIVFGSVQQSENVHLLTMKMFDFAEGRFVNEASEQTIEGDLAAFRETVPAVIEGFLYGKVGTVQVNVTGGDSPELFFDGEKVGIAPTKLENLPLGEHVVSVKTEAGEEKSETVVLRYDKPVTVDFELEAAGEPAPVGGTEASEAPSALPGWVSLSVGVLGAGLGLWGVFEKGRVDDDVDEMCAPDNPFGNVCEGEAMFGSASQAEKYDTLKSDGSTALTLQLVGFSVAGAGLIAGGLLLYRAYSYEEAPSEEMAGASDLSFGVAPTRGGVAAGMTLQF